MANLEVCFLLYSHYALIPSCFAGTLHCSFSSITLNNWPYIKILFHFLCIFFPLAHSDPCWCFLPDVFEGIYRGQKVAIKTLKDVKGDAIDQFLLEADTMTCVLWGRSIGTFSSLSLSPPPPPPPPPPNIFIPLHPVVFRYSQAVPYQGGCGIRTLCSWLVYARRGVPSWLSLSSWAKAVYWTTCALVGARWSPLPRSLGFVEIFVRPWSTWRSRSLCTGMLVIVFLISSIIVGLRFFFFFFFLEKTDLLSSTLLVLILWSTSLLPPTGISRHAISFCLMISLQRWRTLVLRRILSWEPQILESFPLSGLPRRLFVWRFVSIFFFFSFSPLSVSMRERNVN